MGNRTLRTYYKEKKKGDGYMFGRPVAVQEWNRKYSTLNGKEIVKAIMPYHKKILDLRPGIPGLETKMDAALAGIGVVPKIYTKLSLRKFSRVISSVLQPEKERLKGEFERDLLQAMEYSVGALCRSAKHYPKECGGLGMGRLYTDLTESIGHYFEGALYENFEKRLGKAVQGDMREDLCAALFNCAHASLWHPLYYQVGFIATGKFEEAKKMEALLAFSKEGNYPCGMMDNKTFLILVA